MECKKKHKESGGKGDGKGKGDHEEVCVEEMKACASDKTCSTLHEKLQAAMKKDGGYGGKGGDGKDGAKVFTPITAKFDDKNDFEGWNCGQIRTCGEKNGNVCGGYMTKGKGDDIKKTFEVPEGMYRVTLDFIKIDSWDNETAYVTVNDKTCWTDSFWSKEGSQHCGSSRDNFHETFVKVQCEAESVDGKLTVRVYGNLDSPLYDESFAIDNVVVAKKKDGGKKEGGYDGKDGGKKEDKSYDDHDEKKGGDDKKTQKHDDDKYKKESHDEGKNENYDKYDKSANKDGKSQNKSFGDKGKKGRQLHQHGNHPPKKDGESDKDGDKEEHEKKDEGKKDGDYKKDDGKDKKDVEPSAELKAAMKACTDNELCKKLMECKKKHKESGGKGDGNGKGDHEEVCVEEMKACAADRTCSMLHEKLQAAMKKDGGYG